MTDSEWIQYSKDGKQISEIPTSGFVEIIDTFNPVQRTYMDMSKVQDISDSLMWNTASPMCVTKFRYISELDFINITIQIEIKYILDKQIEIAKSLNKLELLKNRLKEIGG